MSGEIIEVSWIDHVNPSSMLQDGTQAKCVGSRKQEPSFRSKPSGQLFEFPPRLAEVLDDVPHRNDVELGAGSGFTQTIEAVKGVKSLSLTRGFSGICVGLDSRCLHTVFPGNLAEPAHAAAKIEKTLSGKRSEPGVGAIK